VVAVFLGLLVMAGILSALAIVAARPASAMGAPPGPLAGSGRMLVGVAIVLATAALLYALAGSTLVASLR
jgi:hypothetical protein